MEDLCRVCMAPGSHQIFRADSNRQDMGIMKSDSVSSLDKLLEKLRYVTLIQVSVCVYKKCT